MKLLNFCIIIFLYTSLSVQAQPKVFSFQGAEEKGISIEELEENYKDAMHVDPELAVFSDNQSAFYDEYTLLIKSLARHLNENDFFWDEPTRIFNRIYFSNNGEIDYFLYNEEDAQFNTKQIKKFNTLVIEFAKTYRLGIEADTTFAQCSPVTYANIINRN